MEGRWRIGVDPDGQCDTKCDISCPGSDKHEWVPVVPCDDAAIERAARALHVARGLPAATYGMDNYCECRDQVLAVLRAAGETP